MYEYNNVTGRRTDSDSNTDRHINGRKAINMDNMSNSDGFSWGYSFLILTGTRDT